MNPKSSESLRGTPNPDRPHPGGSARNQPQSGGRKGTDEIDLESMNFDSVLDDLNMNLTISASDPDPNLIAGGLTPDDARRGLGGQPLDEPQARGEPPSRTSELFPALDLGTDQNPPEPSLAGLKPSEPSREESRGWVDDAPGNPLGSLDSGTEILEATPARAPGETGSEDGYDTRFPWGQLLLLSYASAITFAMAWMLWRRPVADVEPARAGEAVPSAGAEPAPSAKLPPIPAENLAAIGQPLRVGDLEITPLEALVETVALVSSIDPNNRRLADGTSLVLRIKFRNTTTDKTIVPLDQAFVRDSSAAFDRAFVEGIDGRRIVSYPLAVSSEWSIKGQEFPTLAPGATAETIIASESLELADLPMEMTWRLRVRIGVYRTDVVGVKFSRPEVHFGAKN